MHEEANDRSNQRRVRLLLYAFLVLSAAAAFFGGDILWAAATVGDLPLWAPLAAPIAFTAFVIIYTIDRWLLVRRAHYPILRAFFQVGFAIVFLSLLWPHNTTELRKARAGGGTNDAAVRLLQSPNPDVRAIACELLGLRHRPTSLEQISALARGDEEIRVQAACAEAVERLRNVPGMAAPPPPPIRMPAPTRPQGPAAK